MEDQGYTNAIKPIETLKSQAITLTTISAVAGVAVSVLFSYLFISRQRETAQIMMMMGTGRPKTVSYLLYGILLVALIATIVGSLIAGAFDVRVTDTVWQALQDAPGLDERYSERALGIPTTFVPEIATAAWVRWSSAGALILIILIITIIFALTTLRKPKRKKIKEFKGTEAACRQGHGLCQHANRQPALCPPVHPPQFPAQPDRAGHSLPAGRFYHGPWAHHPPAGTGCRDRLR